MDALEKAQLLKSTPTDISNYKYKYVTNFNGVNFSFDSFSMGKFHTYYRLLKNYSEEIQMKKRYEYRPEYVAYDYYGTTNLGFVILYMNDVPSALDFNMDIIIVPNDNTLFSVLTECMVTREPIKVDLIKTKFKYNYENYISRTYSYSKSNNIT